MPVTTLEKAHYFLGSARKAGKAIVRRRRSTFRSRLLGFRLAGCFRPCLAPRANGASGQAEDILVPVWGFPALRAVPRLARCVRFLSSSPSLRTLASIADVRTFDLVWCLDGEWIGLVATCKLQ